MSVKHKTNVSGCKTPKNKKKLNNVQLNFRVRHLQEKGVKLGIPFSLGLNINILSFRVNVLVFNVTFNNILDISWW
jgi:hypothetical protein